MTSAADPPFGGCPISLRYTKTRWLVRTSARSGKQCGPTCSSTTTRKGACYETAASERRRLGETPVLEELDFEGTEVPPRDALEHIGPKVTDPIALLDALSPDTRFFAFVMKRIDWQRAGFRKVQTISTRAGDDQAPLPSAGISRSPEPPHRPRQCLDTSC